METVAAELATIREELEKTEELIVTLNNTVVMVSNQHSLVVFIYLFEIEIADA